MVSFGGAVVGVAVEALVLCGPKTEGALFIIDIIDSGLISEDDKVDGFDPPKDCASMAFIRSCAPLGKLSSWSLPSMSLTMSISIPVVGPVFVCCAVDADEIGGSPSWLEVEDTSVEDGPVPWITSQWTVTES